MGIRSDLPSLQDVIGNQNLLECLLEETKFWANFSNRKEEREDYVKNIIYYAAALLINTLNL